MSEAGGGLGGGGGEGEEGGEEAGDEGEAPVAHPRTGRDRTGGHKESRERDY